MGYVRGRIVGFGLILSAASGVAMWSAISHQLAGVETTATVLGHSSECNVEYQLVISDHRTDVPMDCDAATAFQTRMGKEKVILTRHDYAKLRYAEPGGRLRDIKVLEATVVAHDARIGATVPIVYDPAKPEDARAPMTLGSMGAFLGLLLFGLFLTFAGLGLGPVRMIKALLGGSRGAPKSVTPAKDWSEAAVAERLRAAAQAAGVPSSPSPWQPPSASPLDTAVASPWATARAEAPFGQSSAPAFGKRRMAGTRG